MCFGLPQGHIYPCHMGCIVNSMDKRETDETGDVQVTPLNATRIYVPSLNATRLYVPYVCPTVPYPILFSLRPSAINFNP